MKFVPVLLPLCLGAFLDEIDCGWCRCIRGDCVDWCQSKLGQAASKRYSVPRSDFEALVAELDDECLLQKAGVWFNVTLDTDEWCVNSEKGLVLQRGDDTMFHSNRLIFNTIDHNATAGLILSFDPFRSNCDTSGIDITLAELVSTELVYLADTRHDCASQYSNESWTIRPPSIFQDNQMVIGPFPLPELSSSLLVLQWSSPAVTCWSGVTEVQYFSKVFGNFANH
eukprot:Gregarina_sp_Poly_1__5406@NODE_2856_length_1630_cov_115_818938_g1801_i0_p1_GENE_NODE_2856_length_1630_cov_115_818938_g1801_i0NODE_2856_length_1630_cov_115_818938_g1801_i0_p1_ORF_typecomplete_len226_score22_66_NODE_2856_length_1630_cov_115_818938_g1801_i0308985